MKFSVLMSVYYKEKAEYLEQALVSIYDNQTLKPSEIVIVKDGKLTDELDSVIEKFIFSHPNVVNLVELEKNVGLGKALNIGVKKCSNEIIARMDSDDVSENHRFEKQIKYMNEFDIVGSNVIEFIDDIDNVISIRKMPITTEEIIKFSKKRNPFCHPSVMYKKDSILKCGNYIESYLTEDYNLWVRMIEKKCKCRNIDDVLVYMRTDEEFYKRRGGFKYLKEMLKFKTRLYKKKYINFFQYIYVCITHIVVCLMPNFMRNIFYKKCLRGKK